MAELEPLNVKCTETDCEEDLHCFRSTKAAVGSVQHGDCRECGASLVDWTRVHRRDIQDVDFTFDALRMEFVRHHFWHREIPPKAVNFALRKGTHDLRVAVVKLLTRAIGPKEPFHDGYQTPQNHETNPIPYAQHATATCCRRCVEEWHFIPRGRELTARELEYLSALVFRFLLDRIPGVTSEKQKIPPVRSRMSDREAS